MITFMRIAVATALIASALSVPAPRAQATLTTGACAMTMTLNFSPRVTLTSLATTYGLGGSGTCAVTFDLNTPVKPMSVSGSGQGIFTCEATALSGGSWNMSWGGVPVSGQHLFVGTWGAWTLVATGSNFAAVGQFTTTAPASAVDCTGTGVSSIPLVGALVFQDP